MVAPQNVTLPAPGESLLLFELMSQSSGIFPLLPEQQFCVPGVQALCGEGQVMELKWTLRSSHYGPHMPGEGRIILHWRYWAITPGNFRFIISFNTELSIRKTILAKLW